MLLRGLVTTVVLLAASLFHVAVTPLTAPAEAATGPTYNLFHFNACGHICADGDATFNDNGDPVKAIFDSLHTDAPVERAASLNEMCKNQFDRLMTELQNANAGWRGEFVVTAWAEDPDGTGPKEEYGGADGNLCHPSGGTEHNYGNAILVRDAPIVDTDRIRLGSAQSTNEWRAMICAKADLPNSPDARFCSTHIWSEAPFTQIGEVDDKLDTYTAPVVLMGDFNQTPDHDALDQIYHSANGGGASGDFGEVDQGSTPCRCGEGTNDSRTRKIDYIFFTRADFDRKSGYVTEPAWDSDHDILRGQVVAAT